MDTGTELGYEVTRINDHELQIDIPTEDLLDLQDSQISYDLIIPKDGDGESAATEVIEVTLDVLIQESI